MTKARNPSESTRPQHNKAGAQPATQRNEPSRTEESRDDRSSHTGSSNQTQQRKGTLGH